MRVERSRQEENKIQREGEGELYCRVAGVLTKQAEGGKTTHVSQHHLFRRKEAQRGNKPKSQERERERGQPDPVEIETQKDKAAESSIQPPDEIEEGRREAQ